MTQSPDPLLITIVLATLAIGLPILFVLAIRFLWDRSLNLGRSKELEKLIWQLHRIASAMELQMNLSFPAVQPGTEEPRDIAYLQQLATKPAPVAPAVATPSAAAPAVPQPQAQPPATPPAPQQAPPPLPPLQEPSTEVAQRAGVNSMFGL
jgi:outer membrane biosynthesis protein TonB